ncbi:retrovirus-related pol polyprotein from transposon TNT 1-94 [Tanacetum coccineum]
MCKISHTMQHHNDVGSSSIVANGEKNETSDATSFASCLRPKAVSNMVNFRSLVNLNKVESYDCVLPKATANKVKSRYENSIVGFFVGKDPSFQVVQNYVVNTWTKFGFEKITRNDDGVYLFKFASKVGMEQVLEKGPWTIRKLIAIFTYI